MYHTPTDRSRKCTTQPHTCLTELLGKSHIGFCLLFLQYQLQIRRITQGRLLAHQNNTYHSTATPQEKTLLLSPISTTWGMKCLRCSLQSHCLAWGAGPRASAVRVLHPLVRQTGSPKQPESWSPSLLLPTSSDHPMAATGLSLTSSHSCCCSPSLHKECFLGQQHPVTPECLLEMQNLSPPHLPRPTELESAY